MIDKQFLRGETRKEVYDMLQAVGVIDENGHVEVEGVTVLDVGFQTVETGEKDDDGMPIMETRPGYLVNLYGTLAEGQRTALANITIDEPDTPIVELWT